jgi:excisionase family DNA binding protein
VFVDTVTNGMEALIGASEAAKLLNCSPQTLKRKADQGQIPAMKIGNRWMFLPSLLDSWRRKKLLSNCPEFQQEEDGQRI